MGGVRLLIILVQIARRLEPTLPLDLKEVLIGIFLSTVKNYSHKKLKILQAIIPKVHYRYMGYTNLSCKIS